MKLLDRLMILIQNKFYTQRARLSEALANNRLDDCNDSSIYGRANECILYSFVVVVVVVVVVIILSIFYVLHLAII